MDTVFDWLTMGLFAGLAVLFLQRSVGARAPGGRLGHDQSGQDGSGRDPRATGRAPHDRMVDYLPPAVGCALANQLGNHGWPLVSVAMMTATLGYIWVVLKPLDRTGLS